MKNYSNLSNKELYNKYQEAKANFRNAIEGSKEEIEADRIFTELSNEVESREDFNWLSFKNEELKDNQNKELIQGLKNCIEGLQDGGIINLISFIENEGIKASDELLIGLYDNIKNLNVKINKSINNIPISIKVFCK